MGKLILHTRSFHPLENFGAGGLGFEGDNRDFSANPGDTARIKNISQIDLQASTITELQTKSDLSRNPYFGWEQDYADSDLQPTASVGGQVDPYREDGDQHAQVRVSYRGQNFAMPAIDSDAPIIIRPPGPGGYTPPITREDIENAPRPRDLYKAVIPDLDVTNSVDIHIDREEERAALTCRMVGDGFPNAESFVLNGGDAMFLVTHRRIGSATGQLGGNRRIAMASSSAEVDFPGDRLGSALTPHWCFDYATHTGGPIDVFDERSMRPSTRSGWNDMHGGRDAKGGRVRRWWLDNDVVWIPGRRGSSMP